jgi:myosin-crossreactive antigen
VGGGVGFLAVAFMIRDGSQPGGNISIFEASPIMGGGWTVPATPEAGVHCAATRADNRQLQAHLGSLQIDSFTGQRP